VAVGWRLETRDPAPAPVVAARREIRRQMQFATPGGTRIIWTFHEHLDF
jgi:hypothetical protein